MGPHAYPLPHAYPRTGESPARKLANLDRRSRTESVSLHFHFRSPSPAAPSHQVPPPANWRPLSHRPALPRLTTPA
jgi:hypothetical protein